ncbi:MAG: DUF2293 domain-containing protein [Pirellulales bacterium]|nr:DUF2293 domain-containing protein [Pirellulales bacterium]
MSARQRQHSSSDQPEEIVVFMARRAGSCDGCGVATGQGGMIRLIDEKAYCLACAGLGDLEFLPSGDTAITRRAKKYSQRYAVVVRWSTARKRFERQGLLVEPQAIGRAEDESQDDADRRKRQRQRGAARRERDDDAYLRQFAAAIRAQYPSCPPQEEFTIARHACARNSGRVGRKQAARDFEPTAIRSAVVAHIRHVHTDYDERIGKLDDRDMARFEVGDRVAKILALWSAPAPDAHSIDEDES